MATALLEPELSATKTTTQGQKLFTSTTSKEKKKKIVVSTATWCNELPGKNKTKMASTSSVAGTHQTPVLPAEIEEGNVEYKLKLVDPSPERVEQLMSQLKWRLAEGAGEAIYQIGVTDWGEPLGLETSEMNESRATLRKMASKLKLSLTILLMRPGWRPDSKIAQVLLRRRPSQEAAIEVRVSMLGPVHSGKSTTVSVLTTGMPDNGEGIARMHVSRHKNELDNGLTTSVSSHVLGFDEKGCVTTHEDDMPSSVFVDDNWEETLQRTCKAVKFVDLAGHTM
jgi:GTPase